jgi:hypothetical protein
MDIKSFNRKRIILAVASAPFFFCLVNYFFRFNVFGRYQKTALFGSLVLGLLVLYLNGPTLEEVQEHHDDMLKADKDAYEADKRAK